MRLQYSIDYMSPTVVGGGFGTTIRFRVPVANVVGTPEIRYYKVGDTPGAYLSLPIIGSNYNLVTPVDENSDYIAQYRDDRGAKEIFNFHVPDDADPCWAVTGMTVGRIIFFGVSITQVAIGYAAQGSINNGTNFKSGTFEVWSNSEITSYGLTDKVLSVVTRYSDACELNLLTNLFIGDYEVTPMEVSAAVSNVTSNGGSDGSITLTITGGSGSRTYLWVDGPTTQNRTGLVAGTYHITVTDIITDEVVELDIVVTEPGPPEASQGTFIEIPSMNSITFVVDEPINQCDNPQALDNVLLCNQEHEGFDQVNYFQRFNKCDIPVTQFNSDYSNFEIGLYKYATGELVKSFPFELKEENIGTTEDYGITIRDHTGVGQSRVYFNVGILPIPLSVGESFQILNNAEGYNGNYAIVDIVNDITLGYQYLVITKNFTGPGTTQAATGRFLSDSADFNVFESVHELVDVPEGEYYMKIYAFDSPLIAGKTAYSEPLSIMNSQPGTVLLKGNNIDNAFGMTWTTGYQILLRVPSHFGHRRSPGGERSTNRNSDYSLVKINAKKTRVLLYQVWSLPPYMHEKLSTFFDLDTYTINNVICQTSEGYAEPEYKDRFLLADSSIKIEAKWYDNYNSDDLGSVADGGFISTETGFLKR